MPSSLSPAPASPCSATGNPTGAVSAHRAEVPRLRGDLGVWLVILLELLTFAILFVSYAFARTREVDLFNASQATLNLHTGALNTVLLISGSACVAASVQAMRRDARSACARWLLAALACGSGFVGIKLWEYADKMAEGVDLSTNTFYMFYLSLTFFHFMHVILGMVILVALWVKTRQGAYGPADMNGIESGAAYWHMVDLVWIVLFPLVYVMR